MSKKFCKTEAVTESDKNALRDKLKVYHDHLSQKHATTILNTVSLPSVLVEFGWVQIKKSLR